MFDKVKLVINSASNFLNSIKIWLMIIVGVIIVGQGFIIWIKNNDIEKKDLNYQILLGQHKNLADAVHIQNAAIDKLKIDEAKAEKQFQIAKTNIENKYEDLLVKYKDTPQDKKCAIILERNRKYYEEDKGVNYEEN